MEIEEDCNLLIKAEGFKIDLIVWKLQFVPEKIIDAVRLK